MKLLYITNGINGPGGLERVLSVKASYLAEHMGYEVTILGLNKGNENPFFSFSSKIKFIDFPTVGSRKPLTYLNEYKEGIQNAVDEINPDIISICDNGLKAFLAPRFLKTAAKIIYERHNSRTAQNLAKSKDFWLKARLEHSLMSRLATGFDAFVLLTDEHRLEWPKFRNIRVIPNPLSFVPSKKAPLEAKIVLCVGKISYQKGQDLLLEAWKRLAVDYPDWELHLYGDRNDGFLQVKNLPESVKYFESEKSIEEVYLKTSIYVMSSRFEGFGMVLTEAMASGLPCVSFDCPCGPADVINHNVDGLLAKNGDIDDLVIQLDKLMSNPELRKQLGGSAFQNVRRFRTEEIALQWDQLFKSLFQ